VVERLAASCNACLPRSEIFYQLARPGVKERRGESSHTSATDRSREQRQPKSTDHHTTRSTLTARAPARPPTRDGPRGRGLAPRPRPSLSARAETIPLPCGMAMADGIKQTAAITFTMDSGHVTWASVIPLPHRQLDAGLLPVNSVLTAVI